jgi:FkbM family methyltransferase
LNPGAVIIDVGANCGDTVAAMADANAALHYICIEPDPFFFRYLQKNAECILANGKARSIELVQSLIGKEVVEATMVGSGGTLTAQPISHAATTSAQAAIRSITLDKALAQLPQIQRVTLLKVDVDGFDWDVILSGDKVLRESQPILFFEADYRNEPQRQAYDDLLDKLADRGYQWFCLFDNFGNPLCRTSTLTVVKDALAYVWRQHNGNTARTVYFFDILACTNRDEDIVSRCITSYTDRIAANAYKISADNPAQHHN